VREEKNLQRITKQNGRNLDGHKELIKVLAGENWIFSNELKTLFNQQFDYFNGFEDSTLDLNKGILLIGNVGTGKTSTMDIFRSYLAKTENPNWFKMVESRMIIRDFSKEKYAGLEKHTYNYKPNSIGGMVANPISICIDDLGLENRESKHYGESVDVMFELLADRYSIFTDPRYRKLTHATSNLTTTKLKDLYGPRIIDRFTEMFNVVTLTGESKRK
jgi:hypothetical protein